MAQKLYQIALVAMFYVILPTYDAYSDLVFGIRAIIIPFEFLQDHDDDYRPQEDPIKQRLRNFGIALLVPVCVDTCLQAISFWSIEKNKKLTWPLIPLQAWHQYRAVKVIIHIWKDLENGLQKKDEFIRQIGLLEPYVEALPQFFTKVMVLAAFADWSEYDLNPIYDNEPVIAYVTGSRSRLFYLSITASAIGALHGLSKSLTRGPTKIVVDENDETKRVAAELLWYIYIGTWTSMMGLYITLPFIGYVPSTMSNTSIVEFFSILLLPKLAIAIGGLLHGVGFKRKLWLSIWQQPYLILMPIFTPFVHASFIDIRQPKGKLERHLIISPVFSILNIFFNIISTLYLSCNAVYGTFNLLSAFENWGYLPEPFCSKTCGNDERLLFLSLTIFPSLGYLLPIVTFSCFRLKYHAIVLSDLHTPYFLQDGKLVVETKL